MACESIAKREYFVHDAAMRFSDPDTSGGPPRRLGYNALLAAASRREFDVVVAEDISRLWRNMEMQTRDINELLELGIATLTSVCETSAMKSGTESRRSRTHERHDQRRSVEHGVEWEGDPFIG
jgi:DNA invertase Pin-like site-specific DNA recombinase